jgi:hypothetical protein
MRIEDGVRCCRSSRMNQSSSLSRARRNKREPRMGSGQTDENRTAGGAFSVSVSVVDSLHAECGDIELFQRIDF